jgi:hypothetical protein
MALNDRTMFLRINSFNMEQKPLIDSVLAANEAAISAYVQAHGMARFQTAVTQGQHDFADGMFFGGHSPTWSNRVLREVLRRHVQVAQQLAWIDIHTGLGPSGLGERIFAAGNDAATLQRARAWWGDSVTEPLLGTSSSQEKWGLSEFGYERALAHADIAFVALEFGTYSPQQGMAVLRADHWLHAHGDPAGPQAGAIKAAIRDHFYPPHDDWKEMVLFRSWQVWRQALAGLSAS